MYVQPMDVSMTDTAVRHQPLLKVNMNKTAHVLTLLMVTSRYAKNKTVPTHGHTYLLRSRNQRFDKARPLACTASRDVTFHLHVIVSRRAGTVLCTLLEGAMAPLCTRARFLPRLHY